LEEVAREKSGNQHFSLEARNFLNDSFPDYWTGRGAINCALITERQLTSVRNAFNNN
jgi:hypothetical protein